MDPRRDRRTILLRLAHWQIRRRETHPVRPRQRRLVVGGAIATSIVVSAGAAFAYFTATGSGTGQAQAASVSNLTITAVAVPSPTNQLYPGAAGDVVLKITNPNVFPVTITAVQLPANTTYATGYANSNLTSPIAGCTSDAGAHPSLVAWNFATGSSGSSHTLIPVTVGANNATLTVTMTSDALMGASAPAACEAAYFSMPSIPSVTATSSTSAATSSPTTDSWTS